MRSIRSTSILSPALPRDRRTLGEKHEAEWEKKRRMPGCNALIINFRVIRGRWRGRGTARRLSRLDDRYMATPCAGRRLHNESGSSRYYNTSEKINIRQAQSKSHRSKQRQRLFPSTTEIMLGARMLRIIARMMTVCVTRCTASVCFDRSLLQKFWKKKRLKVIGLHIQQDPHAYVSMVADSRESISLCNFADGLTGASDINAVYGRCTSNLTPLGWTLVARCVVNHQGPPR